VLWDTAGIGEGVVKDGVSDVRFRLHRRRPHERRR
jgi:hypothetical protein